MRSEAWLRWGTLPAVLLTLGLTLAPLVWMVRISLYRPADRQDPAMVFGSYIPGTWSTDQYRTLMIDGYYRSILGFTVRLAFVVTLSVLGIAYPVALLIRHCPPRFRLWAKGFLALPKLANVLVLLLGIELLFARRGPVNQVLAMVLQSIGLSEPKNSQILPILWYPNELGVWLAETYLLLPYAILILLVTLERIPEELLSAARGLGASRWSVFWRITWPLSLPGVLLAGLVSMVWGLGAFLGPTVLGTPEQWTLGVVMHRAWFEHQAWPMAATLGVLLLVLTAVSTVLLLAIEAHLGAGKP